MLDRERIRQDADAIAVVEYNRDSIRSVKRGSTLYIECPAHMETLGRRDEKLGNCIVYKNGCYCMACQTRLNPVEMVRKSLNLSWDEAYRNVADAMGGSSFYETSGRKDDSGRGHSRLFLTEEEASVIGIRNIPRTQIRVGDDIVHEGLSVLEEENPAKLKGIILEKTEETIAKLKTTYELYGSTQGKDSHRLYEELGDAFDTRIFAQIQRELTRRMEICRQVITRFTA